MSSRPQRSDDPLFGRVLLGRYRALYRMARGGMGVVYLGRGEGAEGFVKPVVLKSVLPELEADDGANRMFIREARILARLSHPNIVSILDFGIEGDAYVMALEYVRGYDLRRWYKWVWRTRPPMPVDLCVYIVLQVLDALDYAHNLRDMASGSTQVLHRDISPSNVLLSDDGRVKLVDFGIAKDMGADADLRTDGAGSIKGKLSYLAPELFSGSDPSPASDIYACGAVLREILVGKNVLSARDPVVTMKRVLYEPLAAVHGARPDVSEELALVVEKAMARDPAERFASAAEMRAALRVAFPIDESEVRTRFRNHLRADFYGEMPQRMGLPALEELQAALEAGPAPMADDEDHTIPDSEPPTVASGGPPISAGAVPTAAPPRALGPWIAAAIVALAVIVGVGAAVLAPKDEAEPLLIHHENRGPAESFGAEPSAPAAPAQPVELAQPEPSQPSEPTAEPAPASATRSARARMDSGGSPAQRLQRTVARHSGEFEACFRRHAAEIQGAPEVTLRFSVAADGTLRSADVLPASVAGTAVGGCLSRVARSIRFEPPGTDLGFRIPLRAQIAR